MEEKANNSKGVSKEDVIAKLKDDGDFDRLRLKIIRKLKDNEQLRNNIVSVVKQSAALNRAGAENMKPRQLSDAIYEEVGAKVMSQISDGLWGIIRAEDGMKSEIRETVQSVYNKLVNPGGESRGESSNTDAVPIQKGTDNDGSIMTAASEVDAVVCDGEPNEPPGFTLFSNQHYNNNDTQNKEELQVSMPYEKGPREEQEESHPQQDVESDDIDIGGPPGFSADDEQKQPRDGSDEDPDVPPGFG